MLPVKGITRTKSLIFLDNSLLAPRVTNSGGYCWVVLEHTILIFTSVKTCDKIKKLQKDTKTAFHKQKKPAKINNPSALTSVLYLVERYIIKVNGKYEKNRKETAADWTQGWLYGINYDDCFHNYSCGTVRVDVLFTRYEGT